MNTKNLNSKMRIPTKCGDKFKMNRFFNDAFWNNIYTVDSFYVVYDHTFSNDFYELQSLLLMSNNVSIQENMEMNLMESDFNYNEIRIRIKETGGNIPIRDCVLYL